MDVVGAFKKPFSDITTLVIGIIVFALTSQIVIALIPVIGLILALIAILIVSGYTFEVAVKSSKGDSALPKFSNPVGLLVRGIKVVVAELIYLLPGIVVSAIGAASAIVIVVTKVMEAGGSVSDPTQLWQILAPALASGGIIILPGFLLIFIGWVLWTSAFFFAARNNSVQSAFRIGKVIRNFFRLKFLGTLILTIVLAIIISLIISALSAVGIGVILGIILAYPLQVAFTTILAEGYN